MSLFDTIYRVLRPRHWCKNHRYSAEWDAFVVAALARDDVSVQTRYSHETRLSRYTLPHYAIIGGVPVWVENYPYAYGHPEGLTVLPSARTQDALQAAVTNACLEAALRKGAVE